MNFSPRTTLLFTLCVVALLSLVSFVDPASFDITWLRRADIYSYLRVSESNDLTAQIDDQPYTPAFTRVARQEAKSPQTTDSVSVLSDQPESGIIRTPADTMIPVSEETSVASWDSRVVDTLIVPDNITPLEDFSSDGVAMARFYEKLSDQTQSSRSVRVAFLGDSFIEGDLFTQDLREMLQTRFGGRGVGFVPITSTVSMFRQSVVHTFSGWRTNDIVHHASNAKYTISSYTYMPQAEGEDRSMVAYKGVKHRRFLDHCSVARLFFVNPTGAQIDVVVNDTARRRFAPQPSDKMSYVSVSLDSIRSVRFSVRGAEGFAAYGVSLDSRVGVNVDNYSMRGNSGVSIASINGDLTRQFDDLMGVDMVVLQYGLNVVQSGSMQYGGYIKQMKEVVDRLRELLPDVVIVLMGVPDCSSRTSGEWATKPEVVALASAQRKMARSAGVVHWSTLGAMRKLGGMPKFVEYGWAAKDYTHLSAKGGRKVAAALFDAVIFDMQSRGFLDR